jgi:hypothetical protein
MNDGTLQELARRLGQSAAERLDVEKVAESVVARLRAGEQPERPKWIRPAWLRIAAALVIVVGGAVGLKQIWPESATNHSAHFVADDLTDFSAAELRDVLVQFDELVSSTALPDSTDLHELDAQQLRAVLRSLEG